MCQMLSRMSQTLKSTKLMKINENWMNKFYSIRSNKASRNLINKIDSSLNHGFRDTIHKFHKRQKPKHLKWILVREEPLIKILIRPPKLLIEGTTLIRMI
jgi:hypothetical protein